MIQCLFYKICISDNPKPRHIYLEVLRYSAATSTRTPNPFQTVFFRCTSSPAKHDTFYPLGNRKGQTKEQKKKYTVKHYTAMFFYSPAPGHLISSALKVISFKHGGPLQIFSVYGAPLSRITFRYIFSLAPLLILFVLIFSNPQVHT